MKSIKDEIRGMTPYQVHQFLKKNPPLITDKINYTFQKFIAVWDHLLNLAERIDDGLCKDTEDSTTETVQEPEDNSDRGSAGDS